MSTATVLAIHPGALGDVLLTIPALRALRAQHPDARLVLAAQSHLARLLEDLGEVDHASAFESLGLETLFVDDGAPADVPAVNGAARVVCWFGSRDATFTSRLRALAPEAVIASAASNGTGDVWQHLIATIGGNGEAARGPVAPSSALVADGREALREAGWDGQRRVLLIHAGAGGLVKRWPVEGFAQVIAAIVRHHDVAVAIHEGPADVEAVATLVGRVNHAFVLKQPPLPRLAGALCHVAGCLGNDSGVTHLAAAVGAPTVALFGAENVAWQPWARTANVVVVEPSRLRADDVTAVTATLDNLLD